jgi:hypothetical protein
MILRLDLLMKLMMNRYRVCLEFLLLFYFNLLIDIVPIIN